MRRRAWAATFLATLVAAGVIASAGAYVPDGAPFQVSQHGVLDATPEIENAGLAYNSQADEYLAVWVIRSAPPGPNGIFAQRLSATGTRLGAPIPMHDFGFVGSVRSFGGRVAYNPTANQYLVVWAQEVPGPASGEEVYGQRISASGVKEGPPISISHTGTEMDSLGAYEADVAYSPSTGGYLSVFTAQTGAGTRIAGQALETDGDEVGVNFPIADAGTASLPSLAAGPGDEFLVVWDSHDEDPGGGSEVAGQRVTAAGAELGTDLRLSETGPEGDPAYDAEFASVAYSPDSGEYLVAWQSDALADDKTEVFAQRVTAAGVETGADQRISVSGPPTDPSRYAFVPRLAYSTTADEYLVTWTGNGVPESGEAEIHGQRLGATALKIGGNFLAGSVGEAGDVNRFGTDARIVFNPVRNEHLVTYWANDSESEAHLEVWGQRLAPRAAPPEPTGRCAGTVATRVGTAGRDVIRGTSRRDVIFSGRGDDEVVGLGGRDLICGGAGRDRILGGPGKDRLLGAGGADRIAGGPGADSLAGQGAADQLAGGGGRDSLSGGGGKDRLRGANGRDKLAGGKGRDSLKGGPGRDLCKGGPGRDRAFTCERRRRI